MCPSGKTCLLADCSFSGLALSQNPTKHAVPVKRGHYHTHLIEMQHVLATIFSIKYSYCFVSFQIFWPFWVFQPFLYLSHTAYTDTGNHFYLCLLLIKWANDYCVMLIKQCFQLYRGENMLHFDEMSMIMSSFHWNSMLSWILWKC
jgi:hypothetical protein